MEKSPLLKKMYFQFFEKKLLERTQKIHCIGKSEIEGINKIYPTNKNVLIPYGFEKETEPASQNSTDKLIIFGFIGRIDIYTKGLDVLIDAFEEFQKKVPYSRLWIIGDGKERQQLKEIIYQKRLQNSVEFFGSKFGKEKKILIKQMDIFMHPSRNEGLPVSVIEAANFGKPCIVSSFTNIGEEIKRHNAGTNVNHYSYLEFAKAMFNLYEMWQDGDTFKSIEENAKKMVSQEYDWSIILNKLKTELYEHS